MTAAPDPAKRRALIAAIHAEAKKQCMDDDLRRQVIANATGKTSSADLTLPELGKALDAIKGRAGARQKPGRGRPMADSSHARKARALWLSLWHLGGAPSPSEAALAGFAERQCKVAALQWVAPANAGKVIEGIRARCRRLGFDPKPGVDRLMAEIALIAAQRARLEALGVDIGAEAVLVDATYLSQIDRTRLIARLGNMIRQAGGQVHD